MDDERIENESDEQTDTGSPPKDNLDDLDVTTEEGVDVKGGAEPGKIEYPNQK